MKSTMNHDPLVILIDTYYEMVLEAYRLRGIDKKESKKIYAKAGLIALKINALRFIN